MADQIAFEPADLGPDPWPRVRTRRGPPTPPGARPLELGELDRGDPRIVEAPAGAADPPPEPAPPLLFDEDQLARACAASAVTAATAAERAAWARASAMDATARARLAAEIAALRGDLARRASETRDLTARLVRHALDALLPMLREERLAASIERVLRTTLDAPRPLPPLVLEVPGDALAGLAARAPTLLAEAGLEAPCEVRASGLSGDLIRLRCGELWAELDASAWAVEVCARVTALLGARPAEPHDPERD